MAGDSVDLQALQAQLQEQRSSLANKIMARLPGSGNTDSPAPVSEGRRPAKLGVGATTSSHASSFSAADQKLRAKLGAFSKDKQKERSAEKATAEHSGSEDERPSLSSKKRTARPPDVFAAAEAKIQAAQARQSTPTKPAPAEMSKAQRKKWNKRQRLAAQATDDAAPAQSASAATPAPPPAATKAPLTQLQSSMLASLQGARFRSINEHLYTHSSQEALAMIQNEPQLFDEYHSGFRQQVRKWPKNPVDRIAELLLGAKGKKGSLDVRAAKTPGALIVDMGAGEAGLARTIAPHGFHVLSYDLVDTPDGWVRGADVAAVGTLPLPGTTAPLGLVWTEAGPSPAMVDAVVFCLSLMGTNWVDMLTEAWRILRPRGELIVAEVTSRLSSTADVRPFTDMLRALGFDLDWQDTTNSTYFALFKFTKRTELRAVQTAAPLDLSASATALAQAVRTESQASEALQELVRRGPSILKPSFFTRGRAYEFGWLDGPIDQDDGNSSSSRNGGGGASPTSSSDNDNNNSSSSDDNQTSSSNDSSSSSNDSSTSSSDNQSSSTDGGGAANTSSSDGGPTSSDSDGGPTSSSSDGGPTGSSSDGGPTSSSSSDGGPTSSSSDESSRLNDGAAGGASRSSSSSQDEEGSSRSLSTSTSYDVFVTSVNGHAITSTRTSLITSTPEPGERVSSGGSSYWDDSGAVGGTFAAVGIVAVALLAVLGWFLYRRRKAKRMDADVLAAASAAAATTRTPFDDDDDDVAPAGQYGSPIAGGTHPYYNPQYPASPGFHQPGHYVQMSDDPYTPPQVPEAPLPGTETAGSVASGIPTSPALHYYSPQRPGASNDVARGTYESVPTDHVYAYNQVPYDAGSTGVSAVSSAAAYAGEPQPYDGYMPHPSAPSMASGHTSQSADYELAPSQQTHSVALVSHAPQAPQYSFFGLDGPAQDATNPGNAVDSSSTGVPSTIYNAYHAPSLESVPEPLQPTESRTVNEAPPVTAGGLLPVPITAMDKAPPYVAGPNAPVVSDEKQPVAAPAPDAGQGVTEAFGTDAEGQSALEHSEWDPPALSSAWFPTSEMPAEPRASESVRMSGAPVQGEAVNTESALTHTEGESALVEHAPARLVVRNPSPEEE
ncbi:25S rRNA (adenine(645)-N(1))-methyltransferase [Malassezia caprae]|uniref:Ribosomal RNA-processing protein 8 n=1 Tax=Malassezia caprae TaxID=1381934 RepID=A0AAF0J172_9BASI|nr:25S rRNA (adenine(645)-N(1))-methyltransferase [Malassezia caprae]